MCLRVDTAEGTRRRARVVRSGGRRRRGRRRDPGQRLGRYPTARTGPWPPLIRTVPGPRAPSTGPWPPLIRTAPRAP
jgi:hypothetical protein